MSFNGRNHKAAKMDRTWTPTEQIVPPLVCARLADDVKPSPSSSELGVEIPETLLIGVRAEKLGLRLTQSLETGS